MAENEHEFPTAPSSSVVFDDEISLIDLYRILACRKKMILLVFVSVLVVAVGYLLLADPVYESRVVVRVGQVGKYIEDVSGIKQRLMAEHPMLASVETIKSGATNIFTLTMQNNDRSQAEKDLLQIVDKLLDDHKVLFSKAIDPIYQRIQAFQGQLREKQNQVRELNTQIERFKANDPAQTTMLMMEKTNLSFSIAYIEEQIADLQRDIVEPISMPTRLLGVQTTGEEPIKPNRKVVIGLAVLLGVMLGIFAAFFAEFVAHVREGNAVNREK